MNDVVLPAESDISVGSGVTKPLTAGAMLRAAREAAGLHVAALAVSMKVPVKKLEALEADRLEQDLDAVFVRALASSVCRALKIDAAPVLEKLPQNRVPRLNAGEIGINAPFHASGQTPGLFVPAYFAKPGFFIVLALLVGAAVVVFFPEMQRSEHVAGPDSVAAPAVRQLEAEVVAPRNSVVENVTPTPVAASIAPAVVAAPVVIAAPLVPETPPQSPVVVAARVKAAAAPMAVTPSAAVALAAAAPAGASAKGLVVFKAKGTSWVEVVDGGGVVQLRRTLVGGEAVGVSGSLPLAVVIGRSDALDVEVRGKAFDLSGFSKDSVARFEVK